MSENTPKKKRTYVRKNKKAIQPDIEDSDLFQETIHPETIHPETTPVITRLYPIVVPPICVIDRNCDVLQKLKSRVDTPLCPKSIINDLDGCISPQWPVITSLIDDTKIEAILPSLIDDTNNNNNYLYYGATILSLAMGAYLYFKKGYK